MQLSVPAAALDAVRYAVGTDPSYAALRGVLLDADGETVHVVATDRYRLAVATAPAAGASGRLFLPVAVVDELRALGGTVAVRTADGQLVATAGDRTVRTPVVADEFPDWRRLEPSPAPHQVPLDGHAFRAALAGAPAVRKDRDGIPYDAVVLTLGADGELTVGGDGDVLQVGVNRDFLLDALADHAQLTLELDGPITPLAIRVPDRPDWSLLMPVDLTG